MAESIDFSRQEALADLYAETMPYDEARRLAGLPDEYESPEESMHETLTDNVKGRAVPAATPRRYERRTSEPGDHAFEISTTLRQYADVRADIIPAKGDGRNAAMLMSEAIANKNYKLIKELLKKMSEETDGAEQDDQVA